MSREPPKPNDTSYYGGYYYGEGYGGYQEAAFTPTRSLRDYLIILRERVWWLIITVFVLFVGSAIYTLNTTPIYQSTATIQVLRQQNKGVQFEDVVDLSIRNDQDYFTQVRILESGKVIERVAARLKDNDLRRFMAPYEAEGLAWRPARAANQILGDNRKVVPLRQTLVVAVQFQHPDPQIAALVANLFAQEFIDYNRSLRIEGSMRAVDDLKSRADQQRVKVEELDMQLASFKEKYKSVSFDANTDIDQQELIHLNEMRTADKRMLDEAETQWNMVQQVRQDGRDLWELNFISTAPQVPELLSRRSMHKIELAALGKKYRHKHPRMVEAQNALHQTETELQNAVDSASEAIHNVLRKARENFRNSEIRIVTKREEIIAMQKLRVEYNSMQRNLKVNMEMYDYLYSRMQQAMAQATDDGQSARIIDTAQPPTVPSSPNLTLNLALGLFGGLAAGFGVVFLLALFDDKVKTAFDIENNVGLPLIGIIPRIAKMDGPQKARMVTEGSNRHTLEAFRGIFSTLKLSEESKKAKVILTTSTIPSEGKSFITTNLAFTYAAHGDRTLIIDGDLRMPNIAKSLGIEESEGILQIIHGQRTVDDVLIRNYWKNVDVLTTGGRTKSPTQALSSERFASLMQELRVRYDRIFIDSPPLAPVSDALTVLPFVDGILYVIRFNTVKRKTANLNVRRLRESNVPIFGAILNNINTAVAGYYYSHYYDKSYSHYYVDSRLVPHGSESAPATNQPATPTPKS